VIAADLRSSPPSSLRSEDQVEVRLPLATLWVVLRNQLLIAGRPHPNVDVGWPAPVGDGHVALQAIRSSLAGEHLCPVCIVVLTPGVGQPELDFGIGDRLALFGTQDCSGEYLPAADYEHRKARSGDSEKDAAETVAVLNGLSAQSVRRIAESQRLLRGEEKRKPGRPRKAV
jgi:hypothetical protein